jgi:hypothetical protein
MVARGKMTLGIFAAPVCIVWAAASDAAVSADIARGTPALRGSGPEAPIDSSSSSGSAQNQLQHGNTTARLGVAVNESVGAVDGNPWSLHQADGEGPWCPDWTAPARESGTVHGKGDEGADPCCYYGGCDIFAARFNWDDQLWYDADGEQWTGYVYDNCPCDPSAGDTFQCNWKWNPDTKQEEWIKQRCIAGAKNGWERWEWMRGQCGTGRDVCQDGGYVTSPTGPGSCLPNYYSQQDAWGTAECVPCPDWNCR